MKNDELWPIVEARLRSYISRTNSAQQTAIIADISGSVPKTVNGWLRGEAPPKGMRLIRLWHFLAVIGIESPELKKLPAFNRYLGELLTFSVINEDEAREIVGVKHMQAVLLTLRGQPPLRPQYTLKDLKSLYDEPLAAARHRYEPANELDIVEFEPASEAAHRVVEEPQPAVASIRVSNDPLLTLAYHLSAALPLARYALTNAVTPEARSDFRDLVGQKNMFDLLNELHALQSERARDNRK